MVGGCPQDQRYFKEDIKETKARTRKYILCSSSGECGLCSSENEHDRIMAQRTELFVLARRLQELMLQTVHTCVYHTVLKFDSILICH